MIMTMMNDALLFEPDPAATELSLFLIASLAKLPIQQ